MLNLEASTPFETLPNAFNAERDLIWSAGDRNCTVWPEWAKSAPRLFAFARDVYDRPTFIRKLLLMLMIAFVNDFDGHVASLVPVLFQSPIS